MCDKTREQCVPAFNVQGTCVQQAPVPYQDRAKKTDAELRRSVNRSTRCIEQKNCGAVEEEEGIMYERLERRWQ